MSSNLYSHIFMCVQVPSQLLIQVPRFGKKFKTYEKVIPELVINVGEITVPIDNCKYSI